MHSFIKYAMLTALVASAASANVITVSTYYSGANGSSATSTPIYVGQLTTLALVTTIGSGLGPGNSQGPAYPPSCGLLCMSSVYGSISFAGFTATGGSQILCSPSGKCLYDFYPLRPPSTQITLPAGVYSVDQSVGATCPGCTSTANYVSIDLIVLSGSASSIPEPATWTLITLPIAGLLWRHRNSKRHQRQG